MTFLTPLLAWGMLYGGDPHHHPPAEPPTVPPRGMGADALPFKLTIQANRRRIQIEELLLLLIRIAALVLLFFFLARPVLNPTGLERWLGERRADRARSWWSTTR